jgi:hypothetical protein
MNLFCYFKLWSSALHAAKQLPTLERMKMGRQNSADYRIFCEKFVQGIIGTHTFRNGCFTKMFGDYSDPSDEAMAFLILANNWEVWEDIAEKPVLDDGTKRKSKHSNKKQEYIDGPGRGKSYAEKGREYFNDMYDAVEADREQFGFEFDQDFLRNMQGEYDDVKQKRKDFRKNKANAEAPQRVVCRNNYMQKRARTS